MLSENEQILIKKIIEGDEVCFEKIVNEHKNKIYNFSLNMLYNKEDAQEAALEVFYRFYKDIKRFNGRCKISTYLYQIAKNLCKDILKKKKIKTLSLENIDAILSDTFSPEKIYLEKEKRKEAISCLSGLDDTYREVLILRELENFSYKEISEILKQNLNTVKTNIKRARQMILSRSASAEGSDENERR